VSQLNDSRLDINDVQLAAGDIDKAEPSTDVGPVSRFIPTLRRKSELLAPDCQSTELESRLVRANISPSGEMWFKSTQGLDTSIRRSDRSAPIAAFLASEGQMDWVAKTPTHTALLIESTALTITTRLWSEARDCVDSKLCTGVAAARSVEEPKRDVEVG
jgi:hypothetical protein